MIFSAHSIPGIFAAIFFAASSISRPLRSASSRVIVGAGSAVNVKHDSRKT